jgi:hypothetical protein
MELKRRMETLSDRKGNAFVNSLRPEAIPLPDKGIEVAITVRPLLTESLDPRASRERNLEEESNPQRN